MTGTLIMDRKQFLRDLIAAAVAVALTAGYIAVLEEAFLYSAPPSIAGAHASPTAQSAKITA